MKGLYLCRLCGKTTRTKAGDLLESFEPVEPGGARMAWAPVCHACRTKHELRLVSTAFLRGLAQKGRVTCEEAAH